MHSLNTENIIHDAWSQFEIENTSLIGTNLFAYNDPTSYHAYAISINYFFFFYGSAIRRWWLSVIAVISLKKKKVFGVWGVQMQNDTFFECIRKRKGYD